MMSKNAKRVSLLSVLLLPVAQPALACVTPTTQQVVVWHAGSLNNAFKAIETAFTCQTGIQVVDHATGSLDLVRQITAGGQAADVVAPADFLDIDLFLKPAGYADYDIRFVETKMVLGYLQSDLAAKGVTVADGTPFTPPTSIPNAVAGFYRAVSAGIDRAGGPAIRPLQSHHSRQSQPQGLPKSSERAPPLCFR